jgi:acetyl-CoA carboxylase biotin carboxyl carrier protein
METKEIQKLIDFIAQSNLDEVNIETSELKLSVKKNQGVQQVIAMAPSHHIAPPAPPAVAPVPMAQAPVSVAPAPAEVATNLITIKSPMIGTFYRSPSPDKPNFVEVGDIVEAGKPVCIIEAMKLFNEIESDISGKIVKVLVDNSSPVEFDQPLFLVEPN